MKIGFIGSGNVATHLCKALYNVGEEILFVYSRKFSHASELASKVNAKVILSLIELENLKPDIIIVSVADSAINIILEGLPIDMNAVIVHTSGTLPSDTFATKSKHYGVIYPFQTFSKTAKVNISDVPFMLNANDKHSYDICERIVRNLSQRIYRLEDDQRRALHISGVFTSNFTNYMYGCAQEILSDAGLPFELLHSLAQETLDKAFDVGPYEAQTGPARRKDYDVINQHISSLPNEKRNIYKSISEEILKKYQDE